jgi:hypothetical protein
LGGFIGGQVMRQPQPIIVRVVFELHFHGRERAGGIQNRVSAFAENRFPVVMADGLSGIGKDRLLVFDQVELDVGEVSLSRLEEDLASGIARCLRRWALTAIPSYSKPLQFHSHQAADVEPAEKDSSPANVSSQRHRRNRFFAGRISGLNAAVSAALHKPADWSEFLAALRENHALRRRLADEVSPGLLRRLAAALAPAEGRWIAEYAEETIRLHERQPLLPVNVHVFRRSFWECIFSELAGPQSTGLDPVSFLAIVLRRVAERHSRSRSEMGRNLASALRRHPLLAAIREILERAAADVGLANGAQSQIGPHSSRGADLPNGVDFQSAAQPSGGGHPANGVQFAGELHSANGVQSKSVAHFEAPGAGLISVEDGQKRTASNASRRIDDLAKFLEMGVMPWNVIALDAETELLDLLAAVPDELCALVRRINSVEPVRKRLSSQFREAATTRLLAALAPTAAHWMIAYIRQLRRLHAQKPLFPMRNLQFGQELWELCFEYLGQRKWQNFTPGSFLEFLLIRLAVRRKTSYENLLIELLLRQNTESGRRLGNAPDAADSLGGMLTTLLDRTILGRAGYEEVSRFLIKPEYRSYYSDLDVLAHWLRRRKLPSWSQATDPEDTGRRLGLLLRALPHRVQAAAKTGSVRNSSASASASASAFAGPEKTSVLSATENIGYWLSFGLWPDAVAVADQAQLEAWLEKQGDEDWLTALKAEGTNESAVVRITYRLPVGLQERIIRLLSGNAAALVLEFIHCLKVAGRRVVPVATPVWMAQLRKYALMYLLQASSVSDRHKISLPDLARNSMASLALVCRAPYERLLDAVEHESRGQNELQELCRVLRHELEVDASNISGMESTALAEGNPDSALLLGTRELAMHYLRYGALPENTAALELAPLRRAVALFSDEQMVAVANLCTAEVASSLEKARRIAVLFSQKDFTRLVRFTSARPTLVHELEQTAARLAAGLSTPVQPVLVAARALLLRHAPHGGARTDQAILQALFPGLVWEVVRLSGAASARVWQELSVITGKSFLADKAFSGDLRRRNIAHVEAGDAGSDGHALPHESGTAVSSGREGGDGQDSASAPLLEKEQLSHGGSAVQASAFEFSANGVDDELRGKLGALGHFLGTGQIPWWAENLARESSHEWVGPILDRNPKLLLDTLQSLSRRPGGLERLARYVGKGELERILCAAVPECGGLLLLYIYAGSELSEAKNVTGLVSPTKARTAHWRETLALVLDFQRSKPSPAEVLRELSGCVSRNLGLSQERYVASLLQIVHKRSSEGGGYVALADMLEQLLRSDSSPHDVEHQNVSITETAPRGKIVPTVPNPTQGENLPAHDVRGIDSPLPLQAAGSGEAKTGRHDRVGGDTTENLLSTEVGIGLEADLVQQLDCLLRYGTLPTGEGRNDERGLITEVIEDLPRRSAQYRRYFLLAAGRELERKRMARLLPARLLASVWRLLLPHEAADALLSMDVLEEAASISSGSVTAQCCREIVVEQYLHRVATNLHRRWDGAASFRSAVERLSERLALRPAVLMNRVRSILETKDDDTRKKLQAVVERVELETATMPRLRMPHIVQPKPERSVRVARRMPEGEPFFIGNAGLVLLWPFLQQYFGKLELTEKNAFRDEQAQSRAIHLMQYLATGSLEAPEHQLLLNKILAGAELEQPLEAPAPLAEAEEALSQQVLQGVIQNWEKLKNTSIQGLRSSFLVREGKLLLKDEAWTLTVSAKTYDLLLDSLPWRLALIRLPFMKTVLHVKWR